MDSGEPSSGEPSSAATGGWRTAAVVLLAIGSTVVLAAGNLVFAAHATVLDPGFVTNAVADEDGDEVLTAEMQRMVGNATANATGAGTDDALERSSFGSILDGDPIRDAVTPADVRSQVEPNVAELYAYLHGNSQRVNLRLDARPLADAAGENVAGSIRNATIAELLEASPAAPLAEFPVNASFVERLNEGPDAYRSAKRDRRDRTRERVVDGFVNQTYREASNDELLALVIPDYDPRAYSEREKERLVANREPEIRDALRTRTEAERDGEIDATVEERLDAVREDVASRQVDRDRAGNRAIAEAVENLQTAVVVGATSDQSYRTNVTGARGDLAAAAGDYVGTRIDEQVGVVDLNRQLDVPERDAFGNARTAVGYADLSAIVIPILALLAIGGIWLVGRSFVATGVAAGASLLVATIPGIVLAPFARDRRHAMLAVEGEAAAPMEPVVTGIVDRVLGTVTVQSLALAVLGVVLAGLAVALHYDVDDRFRERIQSR